MKIAVVGSGGREHTIIRKLKENPTITKIYAIPGNGGISFDAECVPIKATDIEKVAEFAEKEKLDFVVVAPDPPLVLGLVDLLEEKGIPSFGPRENAAIIEGSKVFSKELMKKYNIPTAFYEVFDDAEKAKQYLTSNKTWPIVLKADGLALGKGVLICETLPDALDGVTHIMEDKAFGESGNRIVVEEFLTGPEVSVLAFTDGKTLVPMASSMDHKRALDGDKGLNTGGMGTVAPNPYYTKEIAEICMGTIFMPTIKAMNSENRPFKGCLYFGLMLTPKGPKVIEYNCRFGDPETQVVLPLLKTDLLTIMQAIYTETLSELPVVFDENASAACVIVASGGYPETYDTGVKINGLKNGTVGIDDVEIYHAGTSINENSELFTAGGRVLGITATAKTLQSALQKAYAATECISFDKMHFRKDIGAQALQALQIDE